MLLTRMRLLALTLLALTLAACGDDALPSASPSPGPTSAPSSAPVLESGGATTAAPPRSQPATPPATGNFTGLEMAKTGGFAGVDESVSVKPDGSWTRLDAAKVVGSGKLTAAQLTRLRKLAADPALTAEAKPRATAGRCADGFIYTLHVGYQLIRYEQCGPADPKPKLTLEIINLVSEATA